jgi:uncharacterized protein YjbI with pentapeptide repeats
MTDSTIASQANDDTTRVPNGATIRVSGKTDPRKLSECRFLGSVKFAIEANCTVDLNGAEIPGDCTISLSGVPTSAELKLNAVNVRVGGSLRIEGFIPKEPGFDSEFSIDLSGASVGQDLQFVGLRNGRRARVALDSARVERRVLFEDCDLRDVKAVLLQASEIQFNRSTVRGHLDLERAVVSGSLNVVWNGTATNGDLEYESNTPRCWGTIGMKHATFERGGVFLYDCLYANRVELRGARLRSGVRMRKAELRGDCTGSPAFDGTALRCESSVDLEGSTIHGTLKLAGASIMGRVFHGERWDNAPAGSGVKATDVDVRGAEIAELDLVIKSALEKVDLSGAKIQSLFLREVSDGVSESKPKFIVKGMQFRELAISYRDEDSTNDGSSTKPKRPWASMVAWLLCVLALGVLAYKVGDGLWVLVTLFSYALISFLLWRRGESAKPSDRKTVNWLELCCSGSERFDRAFFAWVERWLRESGADQEADEVFLLRKRNEARKRRAQERFSASVLWDLLLDFTIAYGARPARLLHAFVLLWFFGWILFLDPHSVEHPIVFHAQSTTQVEKAFREKTLFESRNGDGALVLSTDPRTDIWVRDGSMPSAGEWGALNALVIATRIQFPIVALIGESDWTPSSRRVWTPWGGELGGLTYENIGAALSLFNFGVLPLLLAGLVGYIKRRA